MRGLSTLRRAAIAAVAVCAVGAQAAPAMAVARGAASHHHGCRVPRLTDLTLTAARERGARAGCTLTVKGAALRTASIQTVSGQSPAPGRRASRVTLWINPLCSGSAAIGPGIDEPLLTPGPTELLSGFYLDGGPLEFFSLPGCRRPEPKSGPGTVQVLNPTTGSLVASGTSTEGHLVTIPLPPGSYTIVGTFGAATVNEHPATQTLSVQVTPGFTVRQDFILQVP